MSHRKRRPPVILPQITAQTMVAEGKAMAFVDGKVLFIEGVVPGDVVDVRITKNKPDYAIGEAVSIITPSKERQNPFCAHFGSCGGCKWQHISYEQQLQYKSQIVADAFKRTGKIHFPEIQPIIPAHPDTYYRNKLDFSFSTRRWLIQSEMDSDATPQQRLALGFHVPKMFDRVVNIEHCYLQGDPSNELRNAVRNFALQNNLSFYDVKTHSGLLRNLIIRTTTLNETMVLLSFAYDDVKARTALLDYLTTTFGQLITSLVYAINPKHNETLYDLPIHTYYGRDHIFEALGDLRFKISPLSFFQTNSRQALQLYEVTKQMANLNQNELVYDLYTGTGSIALFIAKHCQQVVGMEEVPAAIADAKLNAQLNGITNAHFYSGDVKKLLAQGQIMAQHGQPDVLITDPPRAGMHTDVANAIGQTLMPKRVVYVSCNPVTQARDLQLLDAWYSVEKLQPIDMFPHTWHIENVALLVHRTGR